MSSSWLTKLVLAIAISLLPLQALAETVQVLLCYFPNVATETSAEGHAGWHTHSKASHDHGGVSHADHSGHGHSDNSSDDSGSHFCCDAAAAALPLFVKALPQRQFASVPIAAQIPDYLTFLKLPQRPPLA